MIRHLYVLCIIYIKMQKYVNKYANKCNIHKCKNIHQTYQISDYYYEY